jgi:hypothetical protein
MITHRVVRWLCVAVAMLSLLITVQYVLFRGEVIEGCERDITTRKELRGFLKDARDARARTGDDKTVQEYDERLERLRKTIVVCSDEYPLIPLP